LAGHLDALDAAISAHSEIALENELASVKAVAAPLLTARRWREALRTAAAVVLVAASVVGLRRAAFDTYSVSGASMLPTLEPGDIVLGSTFERVLRRGRNPVPRRGDVIVFPSSAVPLVTSPDTPEFLIKRVIGLPGDHVVVRFGATIRINNWTVPSCAVGSYTYVAPGGNGSYFANRLVVEFLEGHAYAGLVPLLVAPSDEYVVKPEEVFVVGDNLANSYDSRSWRAGVPIAAIVARARLLMVGTNRDGSADFSRTLRSIDGAGIHEEGLDASRLAEQLGKCLRERPKDTPPTPPPPTSSTALPQ